MADRFDDNRGTVLQSNAIANAPDFSHFDKSKQTRQKSAFKTVGKGIKNVGYATALVGSAVGLAALYNKGSDILHGTEYKTAEAIVDFTESEILKPATRAADFVIDGIKSMQHP